MCPSLKNSVYSAPLNIRARHLHYKRMAKTFLLSGLCTTGPREAKSATSKVRSSSGVQVRTVKAQVQSPSLSCGWPCPAGCSASQRHGCRPPLLGSAGCTASPPCEVHLPLWSSGPLCVTHMGSRAPTSAHINCAASTRALVYMGISFITCKDVSDVVRGRGISPLLCAEINAGL